MLTNHRRAFWYAMVLLGALLFVLWAVGRHPAALAPKTTLPFVGVFDQRMYDFTDTIRVTPLTWLFRFLNVVGGGIVTIPLRAVASIYLLARRWWRRAGAFILTWALSELLLTFLKSWFHGVDLRVDSWISSGTPSPPATRRPEPRPRWPWSSRSFHRGPSAGSGSGSPWRSRS